MVSDPDGGPHGRMKERRVFLFEQLVIFSEPLDKKKGFSLPGFLYKNSIKVKNSLGLLVCAGKMICFCVGMNGNFPFSPNFSGDPGELFGSGGEHGRRPL